MLVPNTENQEVAVYEAEYVPGGINPRHLHPAAITFHVLSGTGIWQEEGKEPVTLKAGDSLFVPAGTIHSHWNPRPRNEILPSLFRQQAAGIKNTWCNCNSFRGRATNL